MKRLDPEQRWRHIWLLNEILKRKKKRAIVRRKKKKIYSNKIYSSLLNYLVENNFYVRGFYKASHNYKIRIPLNFSFIEDPENALKSLQEIVASIKDTSIKNLHFDHGSCECVDLGASTIMDAIILEAKREWERRKKFEILSGTYSKNAKVNEILKVGGLIKHIDHYDSRLPTEILNKYKMFELVKGTKDSTTPLKRSSQAEITTTELTFYFDNLLHKVNYSLTGKGKNRLSQLIGEVIDNAEQHSSNTKWYVTGSMDDSDICSITIFNFGDSIGKTLSTAQLNEVTKSNIIKLIDEHNKKGFFQIKDMWSEENLWTLFALQEGISRLNLNPGDNRGHGTVSMIEFFLELAATNSIYPPKMVLLSGNTYILFDGKYKMSDVRIGTEKRKVIAFNDNNDLKEKPNIDYVRKLKYNFPGTLISMKFCLDKSYLDKKFGEENEKKDD
jgi:hypothetical protein